MSVGQISRRRSHSSRSTTSNPQIISHTPPPISLTPESIDQEFEPCAATASFLLYSQRSQILVLHHGTLSIERRFELHREDVQWIVVDNVSDRGSGRLAVSFDKGRTAIVWDILSGGEVARFSAYEDMRTACFMRNGNIAFGKRSASFNEDFGLIENSERPRQHHPFRAFDVRTHFCKDHIRPNHCHCPFC